jgi:hypothetical protein
MIEWLPTLDVSLVKSLEFLMLNRILGDDCNTSQSTWVYAYIFGSLKSDSVSANIHKHSTQGYMNLDVATAKGGSSTNPFNTVIETHNSGAACRGNTRPSVVSNSTSGDDSGNSNSTYPGNTKPLSPSSSKSLSRIQPSKSDSSTTASSETPSSPSDPPGWWGGRPAAPSRVKRQVNGDDCNSGSSSFNQNGAIVRSGFDKKLIAHGIMACIAFAILFPFGAISIRLFSFTGIVWFHAGLQIFTTLLFIVALVLGIQLASTLGYVSTLRKLLPTMQLTNSR